MKKIVALIFTILIAPSCIADVGVSFNGTGHGVTSGGVSNPDLFYDSFGTGSDEYDNTLPCGSAPCWTENQGASNTVDADYASGYAGDGLEIAWGDTGNAATSQATFSQVSAVHYVQFRIKVIDYNTSASWANTIFFFQGTTGSYAFYLYTYNDSSSTFDIDITDDSDTYTDVANIGDANWHHLVIRCPSDADTDASFKLDGGSETTMTDVECNIDSTNITYGANSAGDGYDIILDDVGICSEANKANCGW